MIQKTENTGPGTKSSSVDSNQGYNTDPYDYDMGGDYGDFEAEGEPMEGGAAAALDPDSLYREIHDLSQMARSKGASAEWIAQLEGKRGLILQSASLSPEKRQEVLAGIRGDLDSLQEGLNAELEAAPARDSLKKELHDLRQELSSETIDEDAKEDIEDKLDKAEKSLNSKDVDSAQTTLDEAKDDLETAKDAVKAEQKEDKDEWKTSFKELEDQIKQSELPDAKKEELQKKVDALKTESEKKDVDADKLNDSMKDLKKEISKEVKINTMKKAFVGFAAKIPSFEDSKQTSELATLFEKGINSGDFTSFLSKLNASDRNKDGTFHAVRQLVGTIFYALAAKDETKFEQFLDLIPKDVRQAMINIIMPSYAQNNHWSSNENDRSARYLYGNYGQEVAARLEQSMQSYDIKGDEATTKSS